MGQNTIRALLNRNVERQLVREYLLKETEKAGFGGLTFNRTPEGTKVTLKAEQVGRVIGRRGKVIHELQRRLQEDGQDILFSSWFFDLAQGQIVNTLAMTHRRKKKYH